MKTYKVMPHTADVRLWVEGDTLEELFSAALEGMAALMKEDRKPQASGEQIRRVIQLEALDCTVLLVDFLSEVLTLSHREKAIFIRVCFESITETSLKGNVEGFTADGFDDDIKAVTYHEAEVQLNESGRYTTMIVFDI